MKLRGSARSLVAASAAANLPSLSAAAEAVAAALDDFVGAAAFVGVERT